MRSPIMRGQWGTIEIQIETRDIISKVTYILRLYITLTINAGIERGQALFNQQTLLNGYYAPDIRYCSYKGLDHVFRALTEKCKDRPVNKKSAYNTQGALLLGGRAVSYLALET